MVTAFVIAGVLIIIGVLKGISKSDSKQEESVKAERNIFATRNHTPHNHQEVNTEKEIEIMENPKFNTQQLMVSTLTQIGCQPTVNDDDTVSVIYQGESFYIQIGYFHAQIWDLGWTEVNVNDPELPKIREAVNLTNFDYGPTVVMTNPDDKGMIYFHSRLGLFLHPAIPEIDNYMRNNLLMFFQTKEGVRQNLLKITGKYQKAPEKRRPVGFAPTTESKEDSDE